MRTFPFSAVVGSDDMALALILTTVSPEVGGVLVRGEKGTAKSTMVRALAAVLPEQNVIVGCRFACDPGDPDPGCPDGPHRDFDDQQRPARLVELPVGATEDRVIGSLDLQKALGSGEASYEPGLLAAAHRGILYVDEVNLLHDHLVDLLLDAAAMGRSTVEREGVSVAHAARIVLIGTMNPEEGELRPQLLDRFGLTAEIAAPREPMIRAEVVRRRMAYDADPEAFAARYLDTELALRERIVTAQKLLPEVLLSDSALMKIAEICAAFEVDGMRADIVTARAASAHAAWNGRTQVAREDIRAAARLALPHRRRRNPFDAPGLDEDLLDQLLGDDDPEPPPDQPEPEPQQPEGPDDADNGADDPDAGGSDDQDGQSPQQEGRSEQQSDRADTAPEEPADEAAPESPAAPVQVAAVGDPYRTKLFTARGLGDGVAGRRSRALTSVGRTVGADPDARAGGRMHLPATLRAASVHQVARGRLPGERLRFANADLRRSVTEGRESNLVLLCVDASGSMAARRRMEAVKTAVLSLLLDAYQRRDKVGLVTFRGSEAALALPPTSSIDTAARRLTELPSGGRTPLAEGLLRSAETLRIERIRDAHRRPLLVVVTDGRATHGPEAVLRSQRAADHLRSQHIDAVVIDCETGRFRMGLARTLAEHLGARYAQVDEVGADVLVGAVQASKAASAAQPMNVRGAA